MAEMTSNANDTLGPALLGAEPGDSPTAGSAGTGSAAHSGRCQTAAALDRLEAATRGVEEAAAGDLQALLGVMNIRSEAAIHLRRLLARQGRDLDPEEQDRVADIFRRGTRLGERLLVRRAALRSEMQQATASDQVLRRLRRQQTAGLRLNCRG